MTIQQVYKQIDRAVSEALDLWVGGSSLSEIRTFIRSKYQISDEMSAYVAEALGVSLAEFYGNSGRSYDMSRRDRPKNTTWLIAAAVVGMLSLVGNNLRQGLNPLPGIANTDVLTPMQLKRSPLWKLLKKGMLKKATNYAKFRVNTYIRTEYSSAKHAIERRTFPNLGYKWVYIPATEKGYADPCKDIQEKWYRVGTDPLPTLPVHPNCKHTYKWYKERPGY